MDLEKRTVGSLIKYVYYNPTDFISEDLIYHTILLTTKEIIGTLKLKLGKDMKLFKYFFTGITFALIFTSCSKSEDLNSSDPQLIGNWRVAEIYFEGNNTIETSGVTETNSFFGDGYNMVLQLLIDENTNQFTSYGGYNIHLNTIHNGKNTITEWMNPGFMHCGKWIKDGKNLIVTNPKGEMQSATILSLNQHTLVLSYNFIYETKKFDSLISYDVDGVFTFEKQVADPS